MVLDDGLLQKERAFTSITMAMERGRRGLDTKKLACSKCSFENNGKEHRDFVILKEKVLCIVCYQELLDYQKQLEELRRNSDVYIV